MENKINRETATKEVERWLDFKKVSKKKKESNKEQIDVLVSAIVDGEIILEDDFSLTHNLRFEVGEEVKVSKLKYKPRVNVKQITQYLNGVKAGDADGRILAYACALTGEPKGIIQALDTEDWSVVQNIVIFFL